MRGRIVFSKIHAECSFRCHAGHGTGPRGDPTVRVARSARRRRTGASTAIPRICGARVIGGRDRVVVSNTTGRHAWMGDAMMRSKRRWRPGYAYQGCCAAAGVGSRPRAAGQSAQAPARVTHRCWARHWRTIGCVEPPAWCAEGVHAGIGGCKGANRRILDAAVPQKVVASAGRYVATRGG